MKPPYDLRTNQVAMQRILDVHRQPVEQHQLDLPSEVAMLNQSVQDQEALTAYLVAELVDHGFDARVRANGDLEIGSSNRGPDAPVAIVHLDDLLPEYLASLGSGGGVRGEVDPELATGRLLTQLIESFDAVHDADDNNLMERVLLRRSKGGHVVLEEQRIAAGAATHRQRGRTLRWSADRP